MFSAGPGSEFGVFLGTKNKAMGLKLVRRAVYFEQETKCQEQSGLEDPERAGHGRGEVCDCGSF